MTTVDPIAQAPFRQSYPIDFHLYNDDEQEVLNITDDPAGQNLHLEVSNASGQNINLPVPSNTTASADNYHFALRFRPGTLSLPFQTYASFAASALSKPQPQMNLVQAFQQFVTPPPQGAAQPGAVPAAIQSFVATTMSAPQGTQPNTVNSALQAFAVDTASTLQGFLQQEGWKLGYQQEADGTVIVYFLSTQARTLAPGATVAVTLPHVSASGAEGARGTRVELLYQQLTFGNDTTPLSGHRQIYLSIVNQRGQKQIPLHVSFVGFNSILNDGKTPNTLTLRITNVLKANPIALNPAGSSAPSKFILSFDVQDNAQEDWTLGTASEVGALVIAADASWSVTPPTGQEQSPEWVVTPVATKTLLAADEALQLTLSNIITSSPGQTNLYVRYENIPGYWDGQFVVTIDKTPLLYRGSNVGIGTTTPRNPLAIRASGSAKELISFEDATGKTKWHINQYPGGTGLNVVETDVADGRLFIQAGGNVGIGTTTPSAKLTVSGSASHLQLRREATEQTGDKLLFLELYQDEHDPGPPSVPEVHPSIRFHHHNRFWQRIEGRADGIHFKTGDLTSDSYIDVFANSGHFTSINLGIGNSIQQGIHFAASAGNWAIGDNSANAIRVVGNAGGTLAVSASDVLYWTIGTVAVNGTLRATDKQFFIDHPTKSDHHLIHACLEGPESAVYYRGEAQLEHGRAIIQLPDYFEALTRKEDRTVVLTPKGREPFLLSYEDIVDGAFKVYGTSSDGAFSWEVKAVRADVRRLEVEVKHEKKANSTEVDIWPGR